MKLLAGLFSSMIVLALVLLPAQAQTPEPSATTPVSEVTPTPSTPGVTFSSTTATTTATLIATPSLTPTVTSLPTYPAPIAAGPAMWAILYGQNTDIPFAWISPVKLQANQWFVIYLRWSFDPAQGEWSPWCPAAWTRDTSYVSTGAVRDQYGGCLREATSGVGRGIEWFVVIQTMEGGGFTDRLSPESNHLIYIWEPAPSPSLDLGGGAAAAPGPGPIGPPAGSALSTVPIANTDDPNQATTIRGAVGGALASHAAVWYRFDYANNHQTGRRPWVTITLVNGNSGGVEFAVYAPENIDGWWNNAPTGRGTVQLIDCQTGLPSESGQCQSPHLMWQGNFGADGTYWIRVVNNNSLNTNFLLTCAQAQPQDP